MANLMNPTRAETLDSLWKVLDEEIWNIHEAIRPPLWLRVKLITTCRAGNVQVGYLDVAASGIAYPSICSSLSSLALIASSADLIDIS